jgi:hypothetical protein
LVALVVNMVRIHAKKGADLQLISLSLFSLWYCSQSRDQQNYPVSSLIYSLGIWLGFGGCCP